MARLLQCCPGCALQYDVAGLDVGAPVSCSCGTKFGVAALRAVTARAICCSRCGGRLREGSASCEYCEAEITLEERRLDSVCPSCFARMGSDAAYCMSCGVHIEPQAVASLPSGARCPRCAPRDVPLRSRRVGPTALVECEACGGLWVGPDLLQRLCDDAGARKSVAEALGAPALSPATRAAEGPGAPPAKGTPAGTARGSSRRPAPSSPAGTTPAHPVGSARAYIPCPSCREPMNRKNFGSISGILIDVCKDHGVWLDHGELAQALAFAERGGLVEARRREVGELERRRRRAEDPALGDAPDLDFRLGGGAGGGPRRASIGGLLGWLADELFT